MNKEQQIIMPESFYNLARNIYHDCPQTVINEFKTFCEDLGIEITTKRITKEFTLVNGRSVYVEEVE